MERVDQSEKAQPYHQIHYLPHHCVVREDKSTTKLRIVYNASAMENGPALNDCLHTGPPLTPDILDIYEEPPRGNASANSLLLLLLLFILIRFRV